MIGARVRVHAHARNLMEELEGLRGAKGTRVVMRVRELARVCAWLAPALLLGRIEGPAACERNTWPNEKVRVGRIRTQESGTEGEDMGGANGARVLMRLRKSGACRAQESVKEPEGLWGAEHTALVA